MPTRRIAPRLRLRAVLICAATLLIPGALSSPASAEIVGATDQVPVTLNGRTYVLAHDPAGKTIVVRTDGTVGGTRVVERLCVPPRCDGPAGLTALGDRLVLSAYGTRGAIFVSQPGGERFTRRFASGQNARRPLAPFVADGRLYLARAENDRASRWTVLRADLRANRLRPVATRTFGTVVDLARSGDRLLIGTANASARAGETLWSIRHGKVTRLAARSTGGPLLTPTGDGRFYFGGQDDQSRGALWITDGTLAGTTRVSDFGAGEFGAAITVIVDQNGVRYAMAHAAGRSTIARLDGDQPPVIVGRGDDLSIEAADAGRAILRSLSAPPQYIDLTTGIRTPVMPTLVGPGAKFVDGAAVWVDEDGNTLKWSDGTAAGTRTLRTFPPATCGKECNPGISHLVVVAGRSYVVDDARQLWSTDGTVTGTVQLIGRAATASQ